MRRRLIRPALVTLTIVGALLVVGGIAYANIPDGSGTIHACYQKNQGALRVIDTDKTQTCSSSETPLTWSQTGQQGQPGQQGPPGPTGPSDVWSPITSTSTAYFCDLVDSSTTYQDTRVTSPDWVTIPVQAVITLTSPDTISLQCEAANTAGSEAFNWQLAAIKVGTVH